MSRYGPIDLPPLRADVAVARVCARSATPATQRVLRLITVLADEKALLAGAAAIWIGTRCGQTGSQRREADRMLCSLVIAGALPHLFKIIVRRRRPNRSVVKGPRRGIPRSGKAWDSFPSGHAVHLGAMAAPLSRLSPHWLRPVVWPALGSLAVTRILLLAHYPSDVLAGWGIGSLLGTTVTSLFRRVGR
jgi:membrane-associated phospholipid phosphatase